MNRELLCALTALSLLAAGCEDKPAAPPPKVAEAPKPVAPPPPPKPAEFDMTKLAAFQALPADMMVKDKPATDEQVALGRMLYFDKRLSKNHDVSCNTCHNLETFGVDNKAKSVGHKGQLGARNSPTVYNAALHFVQFWDGREATIEAQAKGPILNPVEMAMPDDKKVVAVVKSIPDYAEHFKKAFPADKDPITWDNIANAIGAFERKLVTPSRWDKFLGGDKTALTEAEKNGVDKFLLAGGCMACHMGPGLGGSMYQKLGLLEPWPKQDDTGRHQVTKNDADKMFFKVPSLRNIEKTGPYFHDGSTESLEEAVTLMARHQSGKKLEAADSKAIVAFLGTLTGDVPKDYIKEPELPKSGPKTPKPDPK